jgi:hypothetical protein
MYRRYMYRPTALAVPGGHFRTRVRIRTEFPRVPESISGPIIESNRRVLCIVHGAFDQA